MSKQTFKVDKYKQMHDQQQMIEERRRAISEKLENKKKREAEEKLIKSHFETLKAELNTQQTNDEDESEKNKKNIFLNDGSFMEQFKKLSNAAAAGNDLKKNLIIQAPPPPPPPPPPKAEPEERLQEEKDETKPPSNEDSSKKPKSIPALMDQPIPKPENFSRFNKPGRGPREQLSRDPNNKPFNNQSQHNFPQALPPQNFPPGGPPPNFPPPPGPPPQNFPQGGPQNFSQGGPPQNFPQGGPPQNFQQSGPPPNFSPGGPPQNFSQGGPPQNFPPQGGPPQNFPPQGGPSQNFPPNVPPQNFQGGPPQNFPPGGPNFSQGGPPNFPPGGPPNNFPQGGPPPPNFPGGPNFSPGGPPNFQQGGPPNFQQSSGPPNFPQGGAPPNFSPGGPPFTGGPPQNFPPGCPPSFPQGGPFPPGPPPRGQFPCGPTPPLPPNFVPPNFMPQPPFPPFQPPLPRFPQGPGQGSQQQNVVPPPPPPPVPAVQSPSPVPPPTSQIAPSPVPPPTPVPPPLGAFNPLPPAQSNNFATPSCTKQTSSPHWNLDKSKIASEDANGANGDSGADDAPAEHQDDFHSPSPSTSAHWEKEQGDDYDGEYDDEESDDRPMNKINEDSDDEDKKNDEIKREDKDYDSYDDEELEKQNIDDEIVVKKELDDDSYPTTHDPQTIHNLTDDGLNSYPHESIKEEVLTVKQEAVDLDTLTVKSEPSTPVEREQDIKMDVGCKQLESTIKQESLLKTEVKSESRGTKRRSRWGESTGHVKPAAVVSPAVLATASKATPSIKVTGMSGALLSKVNKRDKGLLQYAMSAYGSVHLSDDDWKMAEDNYKIHLLYQDMMEKRAEVERLKAQGKHKYEYDSDEDVEGGTWEHKAREVEMIATKQWASKLTEMAKGKHHIGDFLPPEELKKFMDKYRAVKGGGGEPDLSDYKEFKLTEENKGFQMLQKLGWSEGQGLGADGSGIVDPVNKAASRDTNMGLGAERPDDLASGDDEYEAYRKRMMLAYRFRPNPLNNPRRPYY